MEQITEIRVAIFASGSGSNAENIVNYFSTHPFIKITSIYCNKPDAFVLERAKRLGIKTTIFNKSEFYDHATIVNKLEDEKIAFIILAGFLWLIPKNLIEAYPGKIVNIHPALLPKYGGKGMYGMYVHEAVAAAKEKETGITIHLVNEKYDDGSVIFQASTPVFSMETAEKISQKVHLLEYQHYPVEIEKLIFKIFK